MELRLSRFASTAGLLLLGCAQRPITDSFWTFLFECHFVQDQFSQVEKTVDIQTRKTISPTLAHMMIYDRVRLCGLGWIIFSLVSEHHGMLAFALWLFSFLSSGPDVIKRHTDYAVSSLTIFGMSIGLFSFKVTTECDLPDSRGCDDCGWVVMISLSLEESCPPIPQTESLGHEESLIVKILSTTL